MKQFVNPMANGHYCFRTDDIRGFMRRCDELGIRYADYGKWAIAGWHQVFLTDPDGNVVEIHQPTCSAARPSGRRTNKRQSQNPSVNATAQREDKTDGGGSAAAHKVCIVTGAASLRGIGYATAELFAEHAAKIVIADLQSTSRSRPRSALPSTGRSPANRTAQRPLRYRLPGRLHDPVQGRRLPLWAHRLPFVNCAAVVKSQSFLSISEQDYDFVVDVNLKGAFNLAKAAVEHFAATEGGNIVNIALGRGPARRRARGWGHYAASKGGVISLTKSIAREYGPQGIRANVVCRR